MGVFFMLLIVTRHPRSWDQLGNHFRIKRSKIYETNNWVHGSGNGFLSGAFRTQVRQRRTIEYCVDKGNKFKNFPYAMEAIDAKFQQPNLPSGNMQKRKDYFRET